MNRVALVLALVGVATVAAGCGGSKPPSVANLAPTTSAQTSTSGTNTAKSPRPSTAALAACFTSHGFAASVGSGGGSSGNSLTVFGVTIGGNVDPNSPQFQAAMQACRKLLPGGGPPALTPAQQAAHARAMASFAACMRKDGVSNFPDPNGQGRFPLASISELDPSSPLFQTAFKACESLEPKVGPRVEFG